MRRLLVGSIVVGALVMTALAGAVGASARADELAAVRAATARFHDFDKAEAAGYGLFYVCTDEAGQGAMGQHYVNGGLVGDADSTRARPRRSCTSPHRAAVSASSESSGSCSSRPGWSRQGRVSPCSGVNLSSFRPDAPACRRSARLHA